MFNIMKSFPFLSESAALLAGMSLPLAFAPFSLFPIAVLSPAILFLLWQNCSPSRAFWRGLLYGMGWFGVGISWVSVSFYRFGGMSLVGSIILTFGFVVWMSCYPAILGLFLNRFFPKNNLLKLLLVIPATWTLIEWLRGWLFTGFPWLSLGYSQIDSVLGNYAPLLGIYGVTWLVILTAGLLLYAWNHKYAPWSLWSLLLVIWFSGWLLGSVSWNQPTGHPLKIALIQGNVPQEFKWDSHYQFQSMQRYLKLSQAQRSADIVVWPETAIPLFYHQATDFIKELVNEGNQHHTDFLIGVPVLEQDNRYFNSIMSLSAQPGFYYKRHLVPFGEYIPLKAIFGEFLKFLEVPLSEFSAGAPQQANLYAGGQWVGLSICYEDVFGELVRTSLPKATLLVNVSNDAWFGRSIAPHQHLEIARMRALENGRYLLRATNTGISAVIDPQGQIVTRSPQDEIYTLTATVQPYQGMTLYARFGNKPILFLLMSSLLLTLVNRRYLN